MFECIKCGICCKKINNIPELNKYDDGNGRCIHLSVDNLCSIYSSRPEICNVDVMYEKQYKNIMSREEYDRVNTEGCRLLQANNDMPQSD